MYTGSSGIVVTLIEAGVTDPTKLQYLLRLFTAQRVHEGVIWYSDTKEFPANSQVVWQYDAYYVLLCDGLLLLAGIVVKREV